jgi:carboxylesterase
MAEFPIDHGSVEWNRVACLMIHGLARSPSDYTTLAADLAGRGALASAILLPGHGVPARQARKVGWPDWVAAVQQEFDRLADQREHVMIIGHSLGGMLALHLAARDPRVLGVVSLCAPIAVSPRTRRLVNILRHLWPYYYKATEDNGNPVTRRLYRPHWVAWNPLYSLIKALPEVAAGLDRVTCPTLVLGARQDRVVPVTDAQFIFERIGSAEKSLVILDRSHHVVLLDVESGKATAAIDTFTTSLVAGT